MPCLMGLIKSSEATHVVVVVGASKGVFDTVVSSEPVSVVDVTGRVQQVPNLHALPALVSP